MNEKTKLRKDCIYVSVFSDLTNSGDLDNGADLDEFPYQFSSSKMHTTRYLLLLWSLLCVESFCC